MTDRVAVLVAKLRDAFSCWPTAYLVGEAADALEAAEARVGDLALLYSKRGEELEAAEARCADLERALRAGLDWLEWCAADHPGECPPYPEDQMREALAAAPTREEGK